MTGWEDALAWSAGGEFRGVGIDRPSLLLAHGEPSTRSFRVEVGLVDSEWRFIVSEAAFADTLDEAAALAMAAWRKRML